MLTVMLVVARVVSGGRCEPYSAVPGALGVSVQPGALECVCFGDGLLVRLLVLLLEVLVRANLPYCLGGAGAACLGGFVMARTGRAPSGPRVARNAGAWAVVFAGVCERTKPMGAAAVPFIPALAAIT